MLEAKVEAAVRAVLLAGAACALACGGGAKPGSAPAAAPAPTATGKATADPTSCTGVMPDAISGFDWATGMSSFGGCLAASSDSTGGYFAGSYDAYGDFVSLWYAATPTEGFASRRYDFTYSPNALLDNAPPQALIFPQASGVLALNALKSGCTSAPTSHDAVSVRAYAQDGTLTNETTLINLDGGCPMNFPDQAWSAANDPAGGLLVAHSSTPGDGTWHLYAQRFDSNAWAKSGLKELAVSGNLPTLPARIATAVTPQGSGFVMWDNGSELRAIWSDADGNPIGGTFGLPGRWGSGQKAGAFAMIDGSVAIQANGQWLAVVPALQQTWGDAPSWLATRPNTQLYIVRGGAAYALTFPLVNGGPLHMALFAPAGNRCGGFDLDEPAGGSGLQGDLGRDGTVVLTASGGPQSTAYSTCRYRFYPALLQ